MFHSIISDYDVFFAENEKYNQNPYLGAVYSSETVGNTPPKSFFSTDPNDYLRIIGAKKQL